MVKRTVLNSNPVPVAQWIERLPSKQRVAGSNPARDAIFKTFFVFSIYFSILN
jgi:hypothetical protein